jgi:branched-chain amino acid transport system permease protein
MAAAFAATPAYEEYRDEAAVRRRRALFTVVLAIFFTYPLIDTALGIGRVGSLQSIFIFVILAMGLNIVTGYAGLLDLGYAAFFAIGAYSQAFLTSPSSYLVVHGVVPGFLQHFWPAMALSWVVAACFGVMLGTPTLRLRGDYLAIVTLGFGEIVPRFFVNASGFTRGPNGISQIATPPPIPLPGNHALNFTATDQRNWYWLILCVGLFSLFLILRFANSRLGRAWMAVREDEVAAASMGVNLVRTKLWAFGLGASFAGFAGAVYAGYLQVVFPDQFDFTVSVMVLSMVILGGIGNVYGVIIGGLLLQSFDRIFAEELNTPVHWVGSQTGIHFLEFHNVTGDRLLIFGSCLVIMMLFRPGGLFPDKRRSAEMQPETGGELEREDSALYYDTRVIEEPIAGERA